MFFPWLVDEHATARMPMEQHGALFARNNALRSSVFSFDAIVALDRDHSPPWAVEEQFDCLGL
jgi:hypothetical protein